MVFASFFVTFVLMCFKKKNSKITYPKNILVLIKLQKSMSLKYAVDSGQKLMLERLISLMQ